MAQFKADVSTYVKARAFLGGRGSRKVAHNTYVEGLGEAVVGLRLHRTVVVRLFAGGSVALDSGGYRTVTTKDRINAVLHPNGWNVFQEDHVWRVTDPDGRVFPALPVLAKAFP